MASANDGDCDRVLDPLPLLSNGGTVVWPMANVGDTGTVFENGVPYTKWSKEGVRALISSECYADSETTCATGIVIMSEMFRSAGDLIKNSKVGNPQVVQRCKGCSGLLLLSIKTEVVGV